MDSQLLRAVGTSSALPPSLASLSGTAIARYEVGSLIGRGGMSEVYEALDPRLHRRVALKVLDKELARSDSFRERFIRESRLAASLSHPNVIPIFEAGSDGDTLFIAMHLVQGSDLGSLITAHGALSPLLTKVILAQAAGALDEAHQSGLLHRDVKPANLLVTAEPDTPHVYLTDFGLTKSLGRDSRITETGQLLGSVHYVSPEHVEGREMDHRADVYSLGCVLFECLTGSVPYERDSDMSVLWAHLNAEIPRPSKRNRKLPNLVDRVIARALAKDPAERFETCSELVDSFSAALDGIAVSLPVPVKPTKTRGRPGLIARRAAGIAATLTLVGSIGAWALTDIGRPRTPQIAQEDESEPARKERRGSRAGRDETQGEGRGGRKAPNASQSANQDRSQEPRSSAGTVDDGSESALDAPIAAPVSGGLETTRTLSARYDVTASDFRGLRDCTPDDTAQGCIVFTMRRDEGFADVAIRDDAGFRVDAWLRQDGNGDGRWEGTWKPICGQSSKPLTITPGARVQVLPDDSACEGESRPTAGLIELTLYRRA